MMVQIENMLSASNEWPQNYLQIKQGDQDQHQYQHDEQITSLNNTATATTTTTTTNKMMMMMADTKDPEEGRGGGGGGARLMEKPSQEQIQQQQQQPLKCPRCESTNTKFCYYNNYSLSQPRHFCKACKRYWTRGGTLRSVPVGGGCRKNKRIRRISNHNPNFSTTNSSSNNSFSNNTMSESNTFSQCLNPSDGGGGGAHLISPLLYGLPTNLVSPHEAIIDGFQFSSSYDNLGGISGLGFPSSGGMILGRNGYSTTTPKEILQDLISSSNPSSHNFHGSKNTNTTSSSTARPTLPTMSMSSLLTSSSLEQHQQKLNFGTLFPYELDLQIKGVGSHGSDEGVYMKEECVKLDGDDHHAHGQCQVQNGYDDQIHDHDHDHHGHQQRPMGESDPSILWNNNNNNNNNNNSNGASIGVNWLDPNYSSLGSSSVPSLI